MPVPTVLPHIYPRRREMRMSGQTKQFNGNVVEKVVSGNATIYICDDYCAKTSEDIEKVIAEYHAAGWAIAERILAEGGTV